MARMGEKGKCFNCGSDLSPVFPRHVGPELIDSPDFTQYDNALVVTTSGGYGMFHDDVLNGCQYEVVICHECAHELCRLVPWLDGLIKPHTSHRHTPKYHETHPGHWGWDYDSRKKAR